MSVSIRRLYNQDCVYQFFVLSKFPFGVSNRGCLLKGSIFAQGNIMWSLCRGSNI